MYQEKHTYYMTLKRRRGWEVLYNIGGEGEVARVLRLNGRNADKIFEGVVKALAKQGAVVPVKISNREWTYAIREDLGPIVGAYFILVRRARNIEKWNSFFNDLLNERYIGIAKAFTTFLELAIELSRFVYRKKITKDHRLSPIVLDALSTSLKHFVNKITRYY